MYKTPVKLKALLFRFSMQLLTYRGAECK